MADSESLETPFVAEIHDEEARRKIIGASEVADIMGMGRRNALDLWLIKSGLVEAGHGVEGNESIEWGHRFEAPVLDRAEKQLGPIARAEEFRVEFVPGYLPLVAHLDGRVIATNEPVDAKTSGICGPVTGEYGTWGEDGSDEVPQTHIIQLHAQMVAIERAIDDGLLDGPKPERGYIAAVIGGRGFCLFPVGRSQIIIDMVLDEVCEFSRMVHDGERPEDMVPSGEVSKFRLRETGKEVPVEAEVVKEWIELSAMAKEADKRAKAARDAVIARLDDAEVGLVPGVGLVTYFTSSSEGYTVGPRTYRTLRLKKGKG
jgi:predicted phage-related endonuclease